MKRFKQRIVDVRDLTSRLLKVCGHITERSPTSVLKRTSQQSTRRTNASYDTSALGLYKSTGGRVKPDPKQRQSADIEDVIHKQGHVHTSGHTVKKVVTLNEAKKLVPTAFMFT